MIWTPNITYEFSFIYNSQLHVNSDSVEVGKKDDETQGSV